ncbi:gamma-glutamylcyclotransferase family protein [Verrucomicrobiota bacterium]
MYYFSYGENMDQATMAFNCEKAVPVGKAVLDGFKFVMNSDGFAAMVPEAGRRVIGVLWKVDPFAELALNSAMGVTAGKSGSLNLNVRIGRNRQVRALVYLPNNTRPSLCDGYALDRILEGARDFNLPAAYLDYLESWNRDLAHAAVHAA